MANTNFAMQSGNEKKVWSLQFWKMARNASFINQFAGSGENSMVQRVTELTKTEKGDQAVITLINDMVGDGVPGDYQLKDNEEALSLDQSVIKIDQLRNANRSAGRMAEQKTVVRFREQSRDKLAYWLADRMDQLAFLTLSGIAYTNTLRGGARTAISSPQGGTPAAAFANLAYAADVTAPTTNRNLVMNGGALRSVAANGLNGGSGSTANITSTNGQDRLTWAALVQAKAWAKEQYVRGIKGAGGEEIYHVFVTPTTMSFLKRDPDFLANIRNAGVRGDGNILFKGANSVMVDGMVIHEFRHVYTNERAATKWGAGNAIPGSRTLLCGAQALGLADIGAPEWDEWQFDYGNQAGIAIAKIFGFKKPVLNSIYSGQDEDFGVIAIDHALV